MFDGKNLGKGAEGAINIIKIFAVLLVVGAVYIIFGTDSHWFVKTISGLVGGVIIIAGVAMMKG